MWVPIGERDWEMTYRQAQVARLSMPLREPPAEPIPLGQPHSPEAEQAFALLRQATALRPDARLAHEGLALLSAEGKIGRPVKPAAGVEWPKLWSHTNVQFSLLRDGRSV